MGYKCFMGTRHYNLYFLIIWNCKLGYKFIVVPHSKLYVIPIRYCIMGSKRLLCS